MKCMYCERKIPEDASFCPYCGQETESGQDVDELQERLLRQLSKEITGELPDTSWERRESREYVREYPVKSSKKYLGVIAIVVLIMVLLLAAIWILFTTMDANERRMQEETEQTLAKSQEDDPDGTKDKDHKEPSEAEDESEDTAEEIRLSFVGEPGDFDQYYKLTVSEASASSVISQEGTDNSAYKAVDGNPKTSWQEGVDGDGIGESIHLGLSKTYMVKYMSFQLGNWNSGEYYDGNNRPKELEITAGDVTQSVTFPDGQVEYWIEFSEECPVSEIDIMIKSVYEGSQWDDTCIAEVGIYGKGN
ncbi:MAG: zinc-ribbon domain-containing protein [Dorea sp.]|jgi:cytoskeletal protein RodZ|nr:zinc-ribbon domain-containing protein [Dorea sp.]